MKRLLALGALLGAVGVAQGATAGLSYFFEPGEGWVGAQLTLTDLDPLDGITPTVSGWEGQGDTGCYCTVDGAFAYLSDKPRGFFDHYFGVATPDVGFIEDGGYSENMAFWLSPKTAITATLLVRGFVSTGGPAQEARVNAAISLTVADPESLAFISPLWSVSDALSLAIPMGSAPGLAVQSKMLQLTVENHGSERMRMAFSDSLYVSAWTRQAPGEGVVDALPVPEPGTWAMLLLGLPPLLLLRRARRVPAQ